MPIFCVDLLTSPSHRIKRRSGDCVNMNNALETGNATAINTSITNNKGLANYQYSLFMANIVICSMNLMGNVAVLILICQRKLLGRTTNVFVFSLAMADVLCCLGAIPYSLHIAMDRSMSVYLCKTYFYVVCVSRTAVAYTVILLTTEKILNILHPARFITAGRCMFFISLVWFFSAAYNVWTVVFYTIYDSEKITYLELLISSERSMYGKRCFFSTRFDSLKRVFLTIDFFVMFVIPCAVLGGACFVIVRKQHGSIKQRFETYYYIMRFIFFIFVVYISCHTPFEIATLTNANIPEPDEDMDTFYKASTTIYYTRGVCFLVIYVYFKQYVCRRNKLRNVPNTNQKTQLDLPIRQQCRGLSLNELRLNI